MKLIFVSNTCDHVVRPLCDGLYEHYKDDFRFIETTALDKSRAGIGAVEERPYIQKYSLDPELAQKWCDEADAVIFASADLKFIANRIKNNLFTVYYSERLFKKGFYRFFNPKTYLGVYKRFIAPSRNSNFYLLCASSYAAYDFHRVNAFRGRMYKWGYQVAIQEKNIDELLEKKPEDGLSFIWVGRLVKLKHCDLAIQVIKRLRDEGYDARMTVIGFGEEEENLKRLTRELKLSDSVVFKGTCPIDVTRSEMDKANIFMFTSDMREGWGATLNECMNSACVCIANNAAGATNFLLDNNKDGYIYEENTVDSIYSYVKKAIESKEERERIARNAYQKMSELWNPALSCQRFITMLEELRERGECDKFTSGPCSKALPYSPKQYREAEDKV